MRFILDNSLLLLAGTLTAVIWANLDLSGYERVAHYLHFAANDVGMVFFFALAAKEVFEATLPGGPLASPRQALSPLAAAVGGMAMPALIFVALVSASGPAELVGGWAIPCATDIAFSAMIARLIFPAAHPAIPFLLLVAIADDALGLVILAVFYPSGPLSLPLLAGLMAAAILLALWLRRRTVPASARKSGPDEFRYVEFQTAQSVFEFVRQAGSVGDVEIKRTKELFGESSRRGLDPAHGVTHVLDRKIR